MALLKSIASGNFTDASTWALCTAVNESVTVISTVSTTTSYVLQNASNFSSTVNANATGVLLKIGNRVATPTGTFSAALYDNAGTTILGECTMDVADIAGSSLPLIATSSGFGHWVFFKFNAPVAITSGTFYRVAYRSSVAGVVNVHRSAVTTGVTVAAIVTDVTQAPAATDRFIIVGDNNASATNPGVTAGTKTAYTVTMNNTTTTQFGDGLGTIVNSPYWSLYVGDNATLTYGNDAATNYNLRIRGNIGIGSGGDSYQGRFEMGAVASPMQRGSTATLEIDSAAAGNHVFQVQGGVFIAQGQSRSAGKNVDRCLLDANASAGATSLTVDTDTGWLNGDEIYLGQTTRASGAGSESRTLNANATATGLSIGVGLTAAREGSSIIKAAIVLVTRNVLVTAVSSSLQFYATVTGSTSVVDCDWMQFRFCGSIATNKQGLYCDAVAANLTFDKCLFNSAINGITWSTANGGGIFTDCAVINCQNAVRAAVATSSSTILNNLWLIGSSMHAMLVRNLNFSVNNLRIVAATGSQAGLFLETGAAVLTSPVTWSNILIHSCPVGLSAFCQQDVGMFTIDNLEIQRCSAIGIRLEVATNLTIANSRIWGNSVRNIFATSGSSSVVFRNCIFASQTGFTTPNGLEHSLTNSFITFENCQFGTGLTGAIAHTTTDIGMPISGAGGVLLRNCILGSTTEVSSIAYEGSYVISENHDQVAGDKKIWYKRGIVTSDNVIARTDTRSLRLAPNTSIAKLEYIFAKTAVASGTTPTVGVYVRKSVVGDGAAYNGSQPRLLVRRNILVGINTDTVIATATNAANGNWELLTGALPTITGNGILEIEVDCDGTTGWVNIDDFQSPPPVDSRSFSFSDDTLGVTSYGNNILRGSLIGTSLLIKS